MAINTCEFCGKEVLPTATGVYERVEGWEKNRKGGGGHGLSLPVSKNRWAHGACIDLQVSGHANQGSMFS